VIEQGRFLLLAMLVALAAAVVLACSRARDERFPHVLHLTKTDCGMSGDSTCLNCTSCHAVSQKTQAHHLPDVGTCPGCHRKNAHELASRFTWAPQRPNGTITFDHARHLAMGEIRGQCVGCHEGVVAKDVPRLPPMKQCFSCHEHEEQWQRGVCVPCHDPGELSRVMPQTFLRHDGDFARRHGRLATSQKHLCQSCHAQNDCDVCHDTTQDLAVERRRPEAIERHFVHRADFVTRHAIEAQANPARCSSCHTPETCDACHVQRGVSANVLGVRNPHPPGWVTNDPSASSGHGREARRDILLCAGCHDQGPATNCIRCHRVGGFGGNPHPSGWRSTQSESSEMCRYCHG
jgi:hypothetical protein